MIPSDQLDQNLVQQVSIQSSLIKLNKGLNIGLMHNTPNSYLEINNSTFDENWSFGRGVIIYSERQNTLALIMNSTFTKNFGY